MSAPILLLTGSPQARSRSATVASAVIAEVAPVRVYGPGTIEPGDVLLARRTPAVEELVAIARAAPAIVLATPVYKATYAGALKALVDLVPEDALKGRPFLGVATAKSPAHRAPVAAALSALAAFFEAREVASPLVVLDDDLVRDGDGFRLSPALEDRVAHANLALARALT